MKSAARWTAKIFVLFAIVFGLPFQAFAAAGDGPQVHAKSWVLMDFESGVVLKGERENERRPPASMTKMMTALVVRDKIEAGELSWEEEATVSARAAAIEEAQLYLKPGEKRTVKELFIAMLVYSANDATVVLAEHVAGSEEEFVGLMNQKAQELGMKNTFFRNATGLDMHLYPDPPDIEGQHVMSAKDSAILARHLMKTYPDVLEVTSMSTYTFREGTARRKVTNWNKMLPGLAHFYEGVDGVKTGHTNAAGYCFTGTAKQGDMRLVTVVMGTSSEARRFTETAKILDYAFDRYSLTDVFEKDKKVPGAEFKSLPNGVERTVPVVAGDSLRMAMSEEDKGRYKPLIRWKEGVKAPIRKGDVLGEAGLTVDGQPVEGLKPVPLVAAADVEEASWIRLFFRSIGDEVKSWFE